MNTLYPVVLLHVVILLHNQDMVFCADNNLISDCDKCSPAYCRDFQMNGIAEESLSTGQRAKRCWMLRLHYIKNCDMCLRRCLSSDLPNPNMVCASTESFNPRPSQRGRRIFFNECAFLKFVCGKKEERPLLWLPWKCMWRRPLDHDDCDATSKVYGKIR